MKQGETPWALPWTGRATVYRDRVLSHTDAHIPDTLRQGLRRWAGGSGQSHRGMGVGKAGHRRWEGTLAASAACSHPLVPDSC